jgi:transcription elongation factor Elf1
VPAEKSCFSHSSAGQLPAFFSRQAIKLTVIQNFSNFKDKQRAIKHESKKIMGVPLTAVTKQGRGTDIHFNCPACGRSNVAAQTFESEELAKVFFVIPVVKLRNTFVKCTACRESFTCLCSSSELKYKSPADLRKLIRYKASGWGWLLSVLALLLCWVPLVNILFAGMTMYVIRGTRGLPKSLTSISLTIGIAITGAFAILIVCSWFGIIK